MADENTNLLSDVNLSGGAMQEYSKVSRSVNSISGLKDALITQLGLTYTFDADITINTKHNIAASEVPTEYAKVRLFGIGIQGEYNVDTEAMSEAYSPSAGELDLYTPIPFRCVPADEDISSSERALYRIRELREIDGTDYFLYWLKLMELEDNVDLTRVLQDGSTVPYEIDPSQLNPVPTRAPAGGGTIDTEVINATVAGTLRITGAEVLEAIKILHGNDIRLAKVSEFGIYSGNDITYTGPDGSGGTIQYTESIDTKLVNKTCSIGIPLNQPESVENRKILIGSNKAMITGV